MPDKPEFDCAKNYAQGEKTYAYSEQPAETLVEFRKMFCACHGECNLLRMASRSGNRLLAPVSFPACVHVIQWHAGRIVADVWAKIKVILSGLAGCQFAACTLCRKIAVEVISKMAFIARLYIAWFAWNFRLTAMHFAVHLRKPILGNANNPFGWHVRLTAIPAAVFAEQSRHSAQLFSL